MPIASVTTPARATIYDRAVADLSWVAAAPPSDDDLLVGAQRFVAWEARLLDERQFGEWLTHWADDGVLWAPLHAGRHPRDDQTMFFDDRRRLGDRVARLADPAAWSQQPPSTTMRTIGTVEAWRHDGDVLVRSACTTWEHRRATTVAWPTVQVHRLAGTLDAVRIVTKALLVLGAADGTRNPAFLL